MTLDQKIQVWVAIGTLVAGLGTLLAVIVALYLSRLVEKVRLKVYAGLEAVPGGGSPLQTSLRISVTNLGERPVTITGIWWAVGKRKQRRRVKYTPSSGPHTNQYPIQLAYGESADLTVSFLVQQGWLKEFATGFVKDLSDKSLKTLVVQVHTSVGRTVEVHPEKDLLDELKKAALNARTE